MQNVHSYLPFSVPLIRIMLSRNSKFNWLISDWSHTQTHTHTPIELKSRTHLGHTHAFHFAHRLLGCGWFWWMRCCLSRCWTDDVRCSGAQMRQRQRGSVHAVRKRSGERRHQIVVKVAFTLLQVLHRPLWLHTRRSPEMVHTIRGQQARTQTQIEWENEREKERERDWKEEKQYG